ncbi:Spectrin beta chain, non-erythrocytic 5 [Gamsiella multidivaricata]|nr:Spectrin beta chain, non-erythrocytic 5 [Gamsiella multidivaricata]
MSWLLKSKRLQSAADGPNAVPGKGNSIYSQGSNNLSSSSLNSNPSSISLALNTNGSGTASTAQSLSSQHHFDAGEDMVRQFAASQLDTQKTAFMRWVNDKLAATPNYVSMASIDRDLRDGKRLIALLELVSKEHLKPERGNMRIHQMANVSKALAFLEKRIDEPLGSIGNEDIVDGNLKLTLGLVWMIIYRFQIQQIANTMADVYPSLSVDDSMEGDDSVKGKRKASQQVDAKQALLRWVRYQLEDYSDVIPPIQDFHRSWRTGLAFAALIHRHDPDFLPEFYAEILPLPFETSDEWRRTLTKAFDIALEKMNLPRLLDPEDLVDVETPDERSIMTYISEYYVIMSKHQLEQDPAIAAELRARRLQAKDERLALAGEDMQARRLRLQEEEERRRREEEEELERIRLKRMEIEGWSLRAAERAKEEEEALRKRREEEEERRLQRKLRREQRERERALLNQQNADGVSHRSNAASSGMGSAFSDSEHDYSDSDTEVFDPREQERRQQELEEKLAEYHQGITELSEWVREQDTTFPQAPDTTTLLDRARDLEPLAEAIKRVEEEQATKEHSMSHLHDVREELLEYENSDLAPERVSEMDKKWWELETLWMALSNRVVAAKDIAKEIEWIIDSLQEIDRVNGGISKFETQLEAFAEKRRQESPQDRSQVEALKEQDYNLTSISFILETYVDFLTKLMDPKVHSYTAPQHLATLHNELTTVRIPRLKDVIEKAKRNLANDRLLKAFFDIFVLSEAWIGESVEWLANIEVPVFVKEDRWNGASTVKEYLARDASQDLDLEYYQGEIDELKGELGEEQAEVNTFRSSGFAKLDEHAKAVVKSLAETQDVTAEDTTTAVEDLMRSVMENLVKVENLLPKEAEHCAYAARVLDYLWEVQEILMDLEQAFATIGKWEMRQPDAEVEAPVIQVEIHFDDLDSSIKNEKGEHVVQEVIPNRHAGMTSVVKDLRVCFLEKQEAIKGDRQMKEFLELTISCQTTLRDFRTKLHDPAPLTGFGRNDPKPFDGFTALVVKVGEAFDNFERDVYAGYLEMGSRVKVMAATSGARQDPTIVQNKLQNVDELLNDVRTLRGDRERDSTTVAECRKLATSLSTLRSDLKALETDFSELEHLEPGQHGELTELGNRANHLNSQFAILEQDNVFRYLAQDPSCSALLQDISNHQLSLKQTQERLQAKLEVKQQWDLAWKSFDERSKALQQYLGDVEKSILDRGFVSLDCLAEEESVWRRSESAVRQVEAANEETLTSLHDFKASRLTELSTMADVLQKVVKLAGGIDRMDQVRADQSREAEESQRDLKNYLQRLHAMNDTEKHQLNTLRQRILWSQHFSESTADVEVLKKSCKDALEAYTNLVETCKETGDTSDLDHTAAEHLKQQTDHLVALAAKQKKARFNLALSTYSALKELVAASTDDAIPSHLESQVALFKTHYDQLGLQLDYAGQLAQHASQVVAHLQKNDAVDVKLRSMAMELKADMEASSEAIEKASTIRAEFETLTQELGHVISSGPRPSGKIHATTLHIQEQYQSGLESVLKSRMDHTAELNEALVPLLEDYEALLRYQNGLRALAEDLTAHSQWLEPSNEKVRETSDRIRALFSTWPGENASLNQSQVSDPEILVKRSGELSSLKAELLEATANTEAKEQEFQSIKQEIKKALETATSHSKHLQFELEKSLEAIEDKIQELKTQMRHKSNELECLEKQVAWEQNLERARGWCHDFDVSVTQFAKEQVQWKAHEVDSSSGDIDQEIQRLESSLKEFENRLKAFESQEKPKVEQAWTNLCGALVFINRTVPDEYQDRQTGLANECQVLHRRIAYSADVLKQRKALEAMNARIDELERLRGDLAALSACERSGDNEIAFKDLEAKIPSLAQALEADFGSLHYPMDDSTDEARAASQKANANVSKHIQECRARVNAAKQSLDNEMLSREVFKRRLELEAIQQDQDRAILDKIGKLEKVSGMLNWADETTVKVSRLLNEESRELLSKVSDDHNDGTLGAATKNDVAAASARTMSGDRSKSTQASTAPTTSLSSSETAGSSNLSKDLPSVNELSQLSQEALETLASRLDALRQEVKNMAEHKKKVEAEITAVNQDKDGRADEDLTKDSLRDQPVIHDLEDTIEQNRNKIAQLDHDIASKLSEFDSKTQAMLDALEQQSGTVASALKERIRMDEERELERLRVLRAKEIAKFEESKEKFLAWSEAQLEELGQLWDACGHFATNDDVDHSSKQADSVKTAIARLETDTLRFHGELAEQENAYVELKDKINTLYGAEEHKADRQRHSEAVDSAWAATKTESAGYREILKQMKAWSELHGALVRFEKEGLDKLEKRVEALRWMHWDAFQPEEEALLKMVEDVEDQARDLKERVDMVNAMELSPDLQTSHQVILEANRAYFDERLESVPVRIDAAKDRMDYIHETSKEIALHAKFHADLVRVETAIAQQIDAVKARLGSLERSSCFALNSKALEAVVAAANEICMDGKYQFSVLQEVEYSALEQTAFDLELLVAEEPSDPEGGVLSIRRGVQESMQRIRMALKQLGGYIEEDCFESLLAGKFYTHCKATEDIRQWITSCRDSMARIDNIDKGQDFNDKKARRKTKELKAQKLETLEKMLNAFGGTVQNYDSLSSDFMLLHHPQSSSMDLTDQSADGQESSPSVSMRVILRQTVQERTKRTYEDWELLKQEFLAKTIALDEQSSEDDGSDGSDVNGSGLGHNPRGSTETNPVAKARALSRFGTEILEDIQRVSREVQEMFDHAPTSQSTLSLAVESDGALIKSKDGQGRLEQIESYIREVLQSKVEKFDTMLSAASEQSEQEQGRLDGASEQNLSTHSHIRHHEKMVGVAMQRGLIAESMNRLVESCNHQRKEVDETVRVQSAMDLIHEASLLCDSVAEALASADSLLVPAELPTSTSLYNLPGASSSSSVASINLLSTRSPLSPTMSPSGSISRATLASRERRASRASMRRSFSLSALSEEDVQQWESDYRTLLEKLDGYAQGIEQRLRSVQSMADRLHDWRLDENIGVATEHWQKLKKTALDKKEALDRVWERRDSEPNQGSGVHPLESQSFSSRSSLMQPTASSNSRVKAILGSPIDPLPAYHGKKRMSTGNIMARATFVPPSPTPSFSGPSNRGGRATAGRVRSGTAPTKSVNASMPDVTTKKFTMLASPSMHAMSPTFSQEAKRRPPVIRKNDSTSSISSLAQGAEGLSPLTRGALYKPDLNNALDVEVARVVNASGFSMRVQKVMEGQNPYLSGGGKNRSRSGSTSSLVLGGMPDSGGYEGGMDSTGSSPRVVKTIRGQSRLAVHPTESGGGGSQNGEVGRYVFGDIEPKVCYCRILRSRKVMVRVGGGWSELSKFMEDHASLEQRKARSKLLSASNSSISVASQFGRSTSVLSGTESRQHLHPLEGSSDSLSDSQMSGGSGSGDGEGKTRTRKKKELIYHIRGNGDDLALKTIKFVKGGAGEGLVAI